ncbi:MAG: 1-deoxy-D-xylulose-5-phosphate synthase [Oscillospiraceae bacterium]|nr:1-deoxy-D-xylulose-5-phosphate synthase [Oscillospiraceae bacterium]
MMNELLSTIKSPKDIKALNLSQKKQLCEDIRSEMIDVISKNGGHLASNLGVVELTVALLSCFDVPSDSIIFDVGHQCYPYKLLTGRYDSFASIRKEHGISGFPRPSESIYDTFVEGHASTSIAQAIGLAIAKNATGDDSYTLSIIGDGALTGGLAFEAMNNVRSDLSKLIVILNDNSMSISKSVGSLSQYLMQLRNSEKYLHLKDNVKKIIHSVPLLGKPAENLITNIKTSFRRGLFDGTIFEEFGFNYIGPVDGHNLNDLLHIFNQISKASNGPYFVHVITQKGKGYPLAEQNPGAYHGVGRFDLEKGNPDISLADSFSNTFGRELNKIADKDSAVFAITAAMKYGTGLQYFYHSHKDRFIDVGIAEEYATCMATGLSKGGVKPVFSVYSTFLQRCYDQLIHDVCLNNSNVLFAIDRAGFVGDDGETHQGIYDVAMLSTLKNFTIISPSNYEELIYWLNKLITVEGPRVIRYPRGKEDSRLSSYNCTGNLYDHISNNRDKNILFVTYGREFAEVLNAHNILAADGIETDIIKLNQISPIDKTAAEIASQYNSVFFIEEGILSGGIGEQFRSLVNSKHFEIKAIDDNRIPQASVARQLEIYGLDSNSLYKYIKDYMNNEKTT